MCRASYSKPGGRFAREQALLQILGTHAAIRRYNCRQHRLPGNLDELHLGNLATDPFTGQALSYKLLDSGAYAISSVGPFDPDGPKDPAARRRIPVIVPYPPSLNPRP